VIVDSSALIAVLLKEPGYEAILDQLTTDEVVQVGAPTLVETSMVLVARVGIVGKTLLARLLEETEAAVIDFTDDHRDAAVQAFIMYGKGRHAAGLNFGGCLTYAVSCLSGERLLCVGEDFPLTDVPLVVDER
jgi:ribonuclease VapC